MQMIMDQDEIRLAIIQYLKSQGISFKKGDPHVDIESRGGKSVPRTFIALIDTNPVTQEDSLEDQPAVNHTPTKPLEV